MYLIFKFLVNFCSNLAIDGGKVKVIEYDNTYRLLLIGDFAMLLYWLFFVIGFSDIVTSYSLCIWFFTKKKETVLVMSIFFFIGYYGRFKVMWVVG